MNRRIFTALLSLGATALGLPRAAGAPKEDNEGGQTTPLPDPVCVDDFRLRAKAKLPGPTFEYITTGSADEITLRENVAAFGRLKVLPPLLTGVAQADLSTVVLKQRLTLPVLLAPVAAQRMYHPQGALAAARAAAAAGTLFAVSSSAGNSAEEIAAASKGPRWFQLYVPRDRAVARRLVERVERAGYQALIVTVDLGEWKDADRRNRFALPREMLIKHLRDVGFEGVTERMSEREVAAFNERAWDLTLSWDFFDWLRSITKLPLLIKGVLRAEDAKKAVALGLDGIIVSNHGGRKLDGMPASIDMLPGVVAAVGGRAEVYLDGGVRRGTDVLKALALGARAVLVGRPYAWALAADGEEGVRKVIEILREELLNAMITSGCARTSDVHRSLVVP
jgi:isopentenyl diphosphate isomerase/L-lactate dehydrogenase-like FMN-dependent dehydrogenase